MALWEFVTHSLWHSGRSGATSSLGLLPCEMKAVVHTVTNVHGHLGGWAPYRAQEQDISFLWGRSCPSCSSPGTLVRMANHRPSHLPLSQSARAHQGLPWEFTNRGKKTGRGSRAGCTLGWLQGPGLRSCLPWPGPPSHLSSLAQGSPHPQRRLRWHHGPGLRSRQGAWTIQKDCEDQGRVTGHSRS